jgi:hypothetical protein
MLKIICATVASLLFFLSAAMPVDAKEQAADKKSGPAAEKVQSDDGDDESSVQIRFGKTWDGRELYSERNQQELVIVGGNYLGENWKNSWDVGGAYYFHFNDFIAVGAQYIFSQIVANHNTQFWQRLKSEYFHTATAMTMLNTPAALRIGKTIVNFDLYFTLGVGEMYINKEWEPVGVIGGGTKFFFPVPWIAFRIDVNSYLHNTPMGGYSTFSSDVTFNGGISFLFPTKKVAASER